MAKLASMFMLLIALQISMLFYVNGSALDGILGSFITNISGWSTLEWILAVLLVAGGLTIVGVVAGSLFGFKSDFIIFAPAIAGLISIGAVFAQFAVVLHGWLTGTFFTECSTDISAVCPPAILIIAMTVGPIAFYYVWTVIEWWRGKD